MCKDGACGTFTDDGNPITNDQLKKLAQKAREVLEIDALEEHLVRDTWAPLEAGMREANYHEHAIKSAKRVFQIGVMLVVKPIILGLGEGDDNKRTSAKAFKAIVEDLIDWTTAEVLSGTLGQSPSAPTTGFMMKGGEA